MRYLLEIYQPGSRDTTLGRYAADNPFMPIHVGDLIRSGFSDAILGQRKNAHLQATVVEHVITETDGTISHKVCVYTEDVPDDWDPIL